MTTIFCKRCDTDTERTARGDCKPCKMVRNAAWKKANPEKVKAHSAAYRAANPEKVKACNAACRKANPEKSRAHDAAYRKANPVKVKSKDAAYRAANPEKRRASNAGWRAANPEKVSANLAAYHSANPEAARAIRANRRARKINAGGTHTKADIKTLLTIQNWKCACCRVSIKDGYHVDHIMPLARFGGSNDKYNLQLLCPKCNTSKGAKHPVDFMQQRGFLL